MKIGTKLCLGFGVVSVLSLALGVVGFTSAQRIERIAGSIAENKMPLIDATMEMKVELHRAHALVNRVPLESDPEVLEEIRLQFDRTDALLRAWADAAWRAVRFKE